MKKKNKLNGNIGENQAYDFLIKNHFKIAKTNYKTKFGEIDIIAEKGERVYFVEVKKRTSKEFGYPCEAVDKWKIQKIKKVAQVYILKNHITGKDFQFSVIEILGDKINFIENIF